MLLVAVVVIYIDLYWCCH